MAYINLELTFGEAVRLCQLIREGVLHNDEAAEDYILTPSQRDMAHARAAMGRKLEDRLVNLRYDAFRRDNA